LVTRPVVNHFFLCSPPSIPSLFPVLTISALFEPGPQLFLRPVAWVPPPVRLFLGTLRVLVLFTRSLLLFFARSGSLPFLASAVGPYGFPLFCPFLGDRVYEHFFSPLPGKEGFFCLTSLCLVVPFYPPFALLRFPLPRLFFPRRFKSPPDLVLFVLTLFLPPWQIFFFSPPAFFVVVTLCQPFLGKKRISLRPPGRAGRERSHLTSLLGEESFPFAGCRVAKLFPRPSLLTWRDPPYKILFGNYPFVPPFVFPRSGRTPLFFFSPNLFSMLDPVSPFRVPELSRPPFFILLT